MLPRGICHLLAYVFLLIYELVFLLIYEAFKKVFKNETAGFIATLEVRYLNYTYVWKLNVFGAASIFFFYFLFLTKI
jgi:hypothetical protein